LFTHLFIGLATFLIINEIDVFTLRFSGSDVEEYGLLDCNSHLVQREPDILEEHIAPIFSFKE
jgi:hypothetical protein